MKLRIVFFLAFFSVSVPQYGQFLIPGEGIMDVKIGADRDEVEWELGFKGIRLTKEEVSPAMAYIAQQAGIDFDYAVSYRHLMWLPVTDLLFKSDKVCLVALNSYHDYNQMLCVDIGTTEGLNFWEDADAVNKIYGQQKILKDKGRSYMFYPGRGIGVEMLDNEIRAMFIFMAQLK